MVAVRNLFTHPSFELAGAANTNVQPYDGYIDVDASAAARTITLPLVQWQSGRHIIVRKTDASANVAATPIAWTASCPR